MVGMGELDEDVPLPPGSLRSSDEQPPTHHQRNISSDSTF